MGTAIMIILGVIIVLKIIKAAGKAAPWIFLGFGIYTLSYYIWDWVCWIMGGLLVITMFVDIWKDVTKEEKEKDWDF